MSDSKPLIAVTGATGAQGGSVARYLLEDGSFRVRGITRNIDSEKAKELASKGVEMIKADFDDAVALAEAFRGAHGVFAVTQFWEGMSEEKEVRQGKALVDAAKAAGVKHYVWSTLDHTTDPYVPHWDSKAKVDDYLKASGIPRTSLYTSFYFENFFGLFPFKTEDGKVVADWPLLMSDGPIGGYAVGETGAYVREAFKHPDEWMGKDIRVVSEIFTPRRLVETINKELGTQIVLKEVDRATFEAARQYPNAEELWTNMEWFYIHQGNPNRDMELTKKLYPSRQSLEEFVKAHKDAFPVPKQRRSRFGSVSLKRISALFRKF